MTYAPITTNLVVNLTSDSGDGVCDATCTLRDAITTANSTPGIKNITFSLPSCNSGSPCAITLSNGELTVANNGVVNSPGRVRTCSASAAIIKPHLPDLSERIHECQRNDLHRGFRQRCKRRSGEQWIWRWIAWRQRSKRRRDLQRRLARADRLHRYLGVEPAMAATAATVDRMATRVQAAQGKRRARRRHLPFGNLTLNDCTINGNTTGNGGNGGIGVSRSSSGSGGAGGSGGGVYSSGVLNVSNTTSTTTQPAMVATEQMLTASPSRVPVATEAVGPAFSAARRSTFLHRLSAAIMRAMAERVASTQVITMAQPAAVAAVAPESSVRGLSF